MGWENQLKSIYLLHCPGVAAELRVHPAPIFCKVRNKTCINMCISRFQIFHRPCFLTHHRQQSHYNSIVDYFSTKPWFAHPKPTWKLQRVFFPFLFRENKKDRKFISLLCMPSKGRWSKRTSTSKTSGHKTKEMIFFWHVFIGNLLSVAG